MAHQDGMSCFNMGNLPDLGNAFYLQVLHESLMYELLPVGIPMDNLNTTCLLDKVSRNG